MAIDAAFTHFPTLETKRLQLRAIQPTDAEALFAMFSDEEVMRFYGHEPDQSLSDTQKFIKRTHANYAQRASIRWGITLKGEEKVHWFL